MREHTSAPAGGRARRPSRLCRRAGRHFPPVRTGLKMLCARSKLRQIHGWRRKNFCFEKKWKIVRECFFVVTKIFYGESSYEVKISYNPILNENSIFFPNHSRIRGEQSNRGPPFRVLVFQPLLPSYNRTQNLVEKQKKTQFIVGILKVEKVEKWQCVFYLQWIVFNSYQPFLSLLIIFRCEKWMYKVKYTLYNHFMLW